MNMGLFRESHAYYMETGSGVEGIFQSVLPDRNGNKSGSTAPRCKCSKWFPRNRIKTHLKRYNIHLLIDSSVHFLHWVIKCLLSASYVLGTMLGAGNKDEQDTVPVLTGLTAHWRRQTSKQGSIKKSGKHPECSLSRGGS